MRRHGWQLPLHPLQIVAVIVFSFLVVAFYVFLGRFLGNRVAENTVLSLFSFSVFSVIVLFVRCTGTDPSDRTNVKKKKRANSRKALKLDYKFIMSQIVARFFRKIENNVMKYCIRRRYLDNLSKTQFEPLLPFPLVSVDDVVAPHLKDDDISFCSLCDFEVKLHSKHCRTCNRCVEGFDHHCKWLNNCIGRRNYTTFILLMVFVLLMLIVEGGTGVAVFIRCFADRKRIVHELDKKFHIKFHFGVLAAISMFLALMAAYGSAALGQLFFFHMVLIKKGIRTYDYILAMKEERESMDPFDDFSSSDESDENDSPERECTASRFFCHDDQRQNQSLQKLTIRIEKQPGASSFNSSKPKFEIDPWKLLKMSKEKALLAAEKAREKIIKQKQPGASEGSPMKPMPLETKHGPSVHPEKKVEEPTSTNTELTPAISTRGWLLSSPRRRFSGSPSPKPQKYRNNFDLKLTEVSRELEGHISRQVLCSVLRKGDDGAYSPATH